MPESVKPPIYAWEPWPEGMFTALAVLKALAETTETTEEPTWNNSE
jgi:hypothetical protein